MVYVENPNLPGLVAAILGALLTVAAPASAQKRKPPKYKPVCTAPMPT